MVAKLTFFQNLASIKHYHLITAGSVPGLLAAAFLKENSQVHDSGQSMSDDQHCHPSKAFLDRSSDLGIHPVRSAQYLYIRTRVIRPTQNLPKT